MKKRFLLPLCFVLLSLGLSAQEARFKITLFGDSVGLAQMNKRVLKYGKVSYNFESNAEAILFFVKTKTLVKADLICKEGQLISGTLVRQKNKEKQFVAYRWSEGKYEIKDNDKSLGLSKPIRYTTTHFFIEEPVSISEVFVERLNKFVPITHLGNGKYQTKVDGSTNVYTYKNGLLQRVKSTKGVSILMERI